MIAEAVYEKWENGVKVIPTEEQIMEYRYLEMLGKAVRNLLSKPHEDGELTNKEIGGIVFQYVQALEKESMRDARERQNRKEK